MIVVMMSCVVFGCSNTTTNESTTFSNNNQNGFQRVDGRTGYSETLVDIESPDYDSVIQTVMYQNDNYYSVVVKHDKNNGDVVSRELYSISATGEINDIVILQASQTFLYLLMNDTLIAISTNRAFVISTTDGSVISETSIPTNPLAISKYKDGFVLMYQGKVIYFNSNCEELKRIENDELTYFSSVFNPLFEVNSKLVLVVNLSYRMHYYEIDFESDYCQFIGSNEDYGIEFEECFGEFIFDRLGEYKLNPFTGEKMLLAEWSNTNVRPEYVTVQVLLNIGIDDYHFVKAYTGIDGVISIQIYTYDPNIDYSDREIITVGGYGLAYEYILRKNIYEYNKLQDEYRVVQFNYEDLDVDFSDFVGRNLALISEFNRGNSPDIFFGNDFDYEYFGRNGMVIDMLPYLMENDRINFEEIEPALREIMFHDDVCYQLFYSFSLNGYWGKASVMSDYTNMTYQEMFSLENEDGIVCPSNYSTDIIDFIIYYSLNELVDEDGNFLLTYDELEEIVRTSIDYGFPCSTPWDLLEDEGFSHLRNDEYLMSWILIHSYSNYEEAIDVVGDDLCFIGFPSVNGSSHMIFPIGNVAVSSGALNPEACVDFLSFFFSQEVQNEIVLTGGNSVSSVINADFSESYRDIINSVDCIEINDFSISNMFYEEIITYETQGKTIELITDSIWERLNLYLAEIYG